MTRHHSRLGLRPALFLIFAFLFAILSISAQAVAPSPGSAPKALKDCFKGLFTIGVAVTPGNITDETGDLVAAQFNSVVAENAMKPAYIEPAEDYFNWDDADAIVAFAKSKGMSIRFHTLEWHTQCPEWFFQNEDGEEMVEETNAVKRAENKKLLLARLENHVKTIVSRYKDDILSWDVVNEVVDPSSPDGMRHSKWYEIAGKDFIETAFRAARAAGGPKVKLYINDYDTHEPAKRDILLKLVKELLAKKVPIDGVGHQTHINLASPSVALIKESILAFGKLGLDNQVTELDMSIYSDDTTTYPAIPDDVLLRQAYRYKELFDAFRELDKYISNVTFWGIDDRSSWLQARALGRTDAPLLYNDDLQPKPAYWALVDPSKLAPLPKAAK